MDGIVITFAVISGVAGAALSSDIVLILGLANLLADGVSMAIGSYQSSKSEREYFERERRTEVWEIEHFPEGERMELFELYREQGFSEDEARHLVEIQTRRPAPWVKSMMVEEHGLLEADSNPTMRGPATFGAFVVAGALPLLAYVVGLFIPMVSNAAFFLSIVLSALALFALGAAKVLVTELRVLRSGLEMLLVGGLAAGVAYIVGYLLRGFGASQRHAPINHERSQISSTGGLRTSWVSRRLEHYPIPCPDECLRQECLRNCRVRPTCRHGDGIPAA